MNPPRDISAWRVEIQTAARPLQPPRALDFPLHFLPSPDSSP
ncbi:hypothetical protein D187_003459 [Cystobacter fuscus DSM 2262]|uniref:Uncharacterized protein n=1 Tax=Cystobacter fuscus (strain ATCC 25194 / DSM 2262 / NBRC 100088 / M29) TaxID=1242864 RepID=S9P9Z9_CYSF2|nr:hypothetical protein D187_003459 [Cystobacter fuscus DSM 2262]